MAKLSQNFFGMPENILTNSLFTRTAGGEGTRTIELINRGTNPQTKILNNFYIRAVRGSFWVTVVISVNSIRVYGKGICISNDGTLFPALDILLADNEFAGTGSTTFNISELYTLAGSIKDNLGNLAYNLGGLFQSYMSDSNRYYIKTVVPSINEKRQSVMICTESKQNAPFFRVSFSKVLPQETFEFDFTISDLCLYEGAYINPKYAPDIVSVVGYQNVAYVAPHGFMLPENLPQHARQYKFAGSKVMDLLNRLSGATYASVSTGYHYSPGYPRYHVMRGWLYALPAGLTNTSLQRWKFSQIAFTSATAWQIKEETFTEDTDYKKLLGVNASDLPKITLGHYWASTGRDAYFSLRFYRTNDNNVDVAYTRWVFKIIYEVNTQMSSNYSQWDGFEDFCRITY